MAATMLIRELNGAGQTATDKTSGTIRFKTADNSTVDLNNPISIPTSLTSYSCEKALRLYISGGTFTQVSNLRAYTDGTNTYGNGIKLWWLGVASYATPTVPSTSNDPPQHSGVAFTNAFTYTSSSPLDMDDLNTGPFDSTGVPKSIGNYLYAVAEVETGASQGTKPAESITWAWDET